MANLLIIILQSIESKAIGKSDKAAACLIDPVT